MEAGPGDVSPSQRFDDSAVKAVFDTYPSDVRGDLLALRALIFDVAAETEGVGRLVETLKWGQPAYLPPKPKIGTTIRIDALRKQPGGYAMFVHCQTSLVDEFQERYPDDFVYQGKRALLFTHGQSPPSDALKHCIALSLTYHIRPKPSDRVKSG